MEEKSKAYKGNVQSAELQKIYDFFFIKPLVFTFLKLRILVVFINCLRI